MKLRVLNYRKMDEFNTIDYHICVDEEGQRYNIDLLVDGGLGKIDPNELVGKTVKISRMHGYINIGHDVELVEEA